MSKIYDFLKECGVFFVLTVNSGRPAGRPFGAVMEHEGDLFICTSGAKAVYAQIKACPAVQLTAIKAGTRAWARADAVASECFDRSLKEKMFEACPILSQRFSGPDAPEFALFRLKIKECAFY